MENDSITKRSAYENGFGDGCACPVWANESSSGYHIGFMSETCCSKDMWMRMDIQPSTITNIWMKCICVRRDNVWGFHAVLLASSVVPKASCLQQAGRREPEPRMRGCVPRIWIFRGFMKCGSCASCVHLLCICMHRATYTYELSNATPHLDSFLRIAIFPNEVYHTPLFFVVLHLVHTGACMKLRSLPAWPRLGLYIGSEIP